MPHDAAGVFVGLQHGGYRVELVVTLVTSLIAYGELRGVSQEGDWALVSAVGRGAAFFPLTGWVDHRRIRDELRLNDVLAVGVTDFLVRVGAEMKRKELDARTANHA
jgi:hypothetical protein